MHLTRAPLGATLGRWDVVLRVAIVVASAVGAAFADAEPTGHVGADVAWRAAAAALVTTAALTAGPAARIAPAVAAAAVAAATESWGHAAAACGVLLATAVAPHWDRWGPPASAALVGAGIQLLLRLPHLAPVRVTTLLGGLAAAMVVASGWQGAGPRSRRVARWGGAVVGGAVVLASAPFAVSGALAWGQVGKGAGEANAWRVATAEGDDEAAAAHLTAAEDAFADADQRLQPWWIAPARFVPVVGQHVEAADVGLESGLQLVGSAQAILAEANPRDLQLVDGALDLDQVDAVRAPLGEGREVLSEVEVDLGELDTTWLLPFVRHDLAEVTGQVRDARDDAEFAERVLDVLPGLLGADQPRRYFVVFSSPAEARELGGILGNWGILTADGGRLTLEETGRAGDLNVASAERAVELRDPESYPVRYVRAGPDEFWQNVTSHPDLPTVARATADLYEQTTDDPIDGVLVVDPIALAGLLEVTGPIDVPELVDPLTADNAAQFLLREQYLQFPELGERVDFLADAAQATFNRLTSGALPGPASLADALGPAVEGRHLLFWAFDPAAEPLLDELGLSGALPPVEGDVLAVARANDGPNKLDAYLEEELAYAVEVDDSTGGLQATLTATYTNVAPAGLPAYVAGNNAGAPSGANLALLSVWTPHQSTGATLDGEAVSLERQVEGRLNRYLVQLDVPRGATVTFTLSLEGAIPAGGYRLTVVRQPLAQPSPVTVDLRDRDGRALSDVPKTIVMGG